MDATESRPQQGIGGDNIGEEVEVERSPLRRDKTRAYRTFSKPPILSQRCSVVGYEPIGEHGDESCVDQQPYLGLYDDPLPFCGCGLGWFLFLLGFVIPPAWLYASFVFYSAHHERDPRERPGLAACAVAAMVTVTVALVTGLVLFLKRSNV